VSDKHKLDINESISSTNSLPRMERCPVCKEMDVEYAITPDGCTTCNPIFHEGRELYKRKEEES